MKCKLKMRRISKSLFHLALLSSVIASLLLVSCEKELMGYQGEEGVYFAVRRGHNVIYIQQWPYHPTTNVNLFSLSHKDTIVGITVALTGPQKDYDRSFHVEINPDSTSALVDEHFQIVNPAPVIPAHSSSTEVLVKLFKSADLKAARKSIGLRLKEGSELRLSFPKFQAIPGYTNTDEAIVQEFDASLHTLYVQDFLPKPAVWQGMISATNQETSLWGAYTEKKILLMCELMQLSYSDFESTKTMPIVLQQLIARQMAAHLVTQFNAGSPVLEEDGRLMYVTGVPWTSIVGTPWKK